MENVPVSSLLTFNRYLDIGKQIPGQYNSAACVTARNFGTKEILQFHDFSPNAEIKSQESRPPTKNILTQLRRHFK